MSLTEGIATIVILILISITIPWLIIYKLTWEAELKDTLIILAGLSFIVFEGLTNLAVAIGKYKGLFLYQSVFIYIGSVIIIAILLRRINFLKHYSYIDKLTGTYNQRALYRYINKAKKANSIFTLVFIDIDDFKLINDNYGHIAADKILQNMCLNIRQKVRDKDLIFRYGGDEFVLMFLGTNKNDTNKIMERIKSEINKESNLILTFSYGTATYPEEGHTAEKLLQVADLEMYCQKKYKPPMQLNNSGDTKRFYLA